jgi:hypothetical protein
MRAHMPTGRTKSGLLCLLAFATPAQAETLVNIADAENGDALFVDRATLRTVGPLSGYRGFPATQIWAINLVKASRRAPARTERFQFSFNCAQRTSLILTYQNSRTGTKLQDWKAADLDFKYEPPRPGSLADFSMLFACSGGRLPVMPSKSADDNGDSDDAEATAP